MKSRLRLPGLDGADWTLSQHQGQVVVLNFWATWCDPCRHEMPTLDALAQDYADQGLAVVAVNFKEPAARVRRFVAQSGLSLRVVLDTDGQAAHQFGVRLYPTTFVLTRHGDVAYVVAGETDWNDGAPRRRLEQLLI
jgi:thiol-disulfide isomerase/thioredoxin